MSVRRGHRLMRAASEDFRKQASAVHDRYEHADYYKLS